MLGKRCRTIQRTASISQNMGPHYLHHHNYHHHHDVAAATKAISHDAPEAPASSVLSHNLHAGNSQVPAIIPQIIGFNPIIKSANCAGVGDNQYEASPQPKLVGSPAGATDFDHGTASVLLQPTLLGTLQPHDMYDDDPKHHNTRSAGSSGSPSTKRSQITPRSALQTLLAAARQITYSDQSGSSAKNYSSKSSELAKKSSFKATNPTSPATCASNSTLNASAKQGSFIWQGLTLGEATSKELPSINKQFMNIPKASMPVTTQAKGAAPHEFCQNWNMNEAPANEYIHNVQDISEVDSENIFDVEGTSSNLGGAVINHGQISLEPTKDSHALYLATSPLTADFVPNSAASMSFLESCYLCKRPLGQGRDIFMYRGENAFCSVECRDRQMRLEERKEKLQYIHSQMSKLNVQKQGLYISRNPAGRGSNSTNITPCYHPHQPHSRHLPHHHQQYVSHSQAVAYNNKQHRTSLLMPAA